MDNHSIDATATEPGKRLCDGTAQSGLSKPAGVLKVVMRRSGQAYSVCRRGHEERFGRQGLFAHDHTHPLAMANAAVACVSPAGTFDRARRAEHRKEPETHAVED